MDLASGRGARRKMEIDVARERVKRVQAVADTRCLCITKPFHKTIFLLHAHCNGCRYDLSTRKRHTLPQAVVCK